MAFYYSRRKVQPKEHEDAGELNIVPYLDILMNLIIFMLLSMTGLAAFGVLNVNAPTYAGAGAGGSGEQDKPPFILSVAVSKRGFFIAGTGAVLPGSNTEGSDQNAPTIPLKGDASYDYEALNKRMEEIKRAYPDESKLILAADAEIPYEVLVATMDATRESHDRKALFPDVTLASF